LSLDLGLDDAQQAVADAIDQFCRDRCDEEAVRATAGRFPDSLWSEIAQLGVLALATPEGDGGAMEAVAACESLGRAVFPGPLPATFLATQLLPAESRASVARGAAVAAVGDSSVVPWAPVASLFVEVADGEAWLCEAAGAVEAVDTLGGEPWGRVALERRERLGDVGRALALHDTTLAAYAAAAGQALVEVTADHVRTRKQFGRALGEFQAVAHPLADCRMQLDAAATLARIAAYHFDADPTAPGSHTAAAAARLSATQAGVFAVHVCHQLFGALGITTEGPIFHRTRRIRQLASQPPGETHARALVLDAFAPPGAGAVGASA